MADDERSNRTWKRIILQQLIIILYGMSQILHLTSIEKLMAIAMWGSIFLVWGAILYEYDADRKAKQTKRAEHERIARLIEADTSDDYEYANGVEETEGKRKV